MSNVYIENYITHLDTLRNLIIIIVFYTGASKMCHEQLNTETLKFTVLSQYKIIKNNHELHVVIKYYRIR